MAAFHIDPDVEANYPIVLSDALQGRGTKEAVTAIRCMPESFPVLKMKLTLPFR
jgi:hypothetical protein